VQQSALLYLFLQEMGKNQEELGRITNGRERENCSPRFDMKSYASVQRNYLQALHNISIGYWYQYHFKIIFRAPQANLDVYQKKNSSIGTGWDGDPAHEGGEGTSILKKKSTACDVILKESVPAGRRTCFVTSKPRTPLDAHTKNTDSKPTPRVSFCGMPDSESVMVPCAADAIFDCFEQEAMAQKGNLTLMNILRKKKHVFRACRYANEKMYIAVHVRNAFHSQNPSARFLSKSPSDTWHELGTDATTDIILLLFEGHDSCVYQKTFHDFVIGDAPISFKLPREEDALFGCVEGTIPQQRGNMLLREMVKRKKPLFHTCRFGAEKRYIATSIQKKFKAALPSARFLHQEHSKTWEEFSDNEITDVIILLLKGDLSALYNNHSKGVTKNEAAAYLDPGMPTTCAMEQEFAETPAFFLRGIEGVADFLLGSYSFDTITSYESMTPLIEQMPSYDSISYDLSILSGV